MTIVYTKEIGSLPAYREIDGNSDVVFAVNWTLVGAEGVFSASSTLCTEVPYVAGSPFTPYADLTQEQVLGWINQYTDPLSISSAETSISYAIAQQQTVTIPPLPWSPPPPPGT